MTDGDFPSSDLYVRSIVEEQVRSLREIIKGVSQKAPLSDDSLSLTTFCKWSLWPRQPTSRTESGRGRSEARPLRSRQPPVGHSH